MYKTILVLPLGPRSKCNSRVQGGRGQTYGGGHRNRSRRGDCKIGFVIGVVCIGVVGERVIRVHGISPQFSRGKNREVRSFDPSAKKLLLSLFFVFVLLSYVHVAPQLLI